MAETLKRLLFDIEDIFFSKFNGLDLSGLVKREDLVCDNTDSHQHATAYHAVWCRNLRELFKESKKTGIPFQNFVDIGSGKGKACFYASRKMRFTQITGIEFSRPLVDIARKNSARFADRNITFLHTDAVTFSLSPGNSLIFLFNPFDNLILETFGKNNLDHFKKYKSIIAYANDVHRSTLANLGFETIFRNQTRKISLHQLR
jgi:SAM-dependent methyltransferase